jgi:hypothetical protein
MNNFKNLLILTLTALLGLSLFTQPAQSASTSSTAKAIQYEFCLSKSLPEIDLAPDTFDDSRIGLFATYIDFGIKACKKYKP